MFRPEKTAIKRKRESLPARRFLNEAVVQDWTTVLDWGCGKGRDVLYFAANGLIARGYDPHSRPTEPSNLTYRYITCFYVLNVIPTHEGRVECLKRAFSHADYDGAMYIAVRPWSSINYYPKLVYSIQVY